MKKMTRWGIGPLFGIFTFIEAMVLLWLNHLSPWNFSFPFQSEIGIALMIIGFIIFIYPAVTIDKYFNDGKLRTTGMYQICRHPIYASWILIIIPGIVVYWGAVLAILLPFYAYLAFISFIYKEEDYLAEKFGPEYMKYKSSVNAIFPTFKIKA